MELTKFKDVTLSFFLKGKKRNIVSEMTHDFSLTEHQVWISDDRLLLNAVFHLLTSNVQPTKGKITNPLKKYFAIKPVPLLNHFTLKQYLKTLLAIITPKSMDSNRIWHLVCHHHQLTHKKLSEIVEYLPVESQIAYLLSLAILLELPTLFIHNTYLNSALILLPQSLHDAWSKYLRNQVVISIVYHEKETSIHQDIKRILTFTPHEVIEEMKKTYETYR